jgi:hypothetical protein
MDNKDFSIVIPANSTTDSIQKMLKKTVQCPYKPFHKFTPVTANIKGVRAYPPKQREIVTSEVTAPRPSTEREAPTVLISAKAFGQTIAVEVMRGEASQAITFPAVEVETYVKLMRVALNFGQVTVRNAIIAFLLAHGGGTKTVIAGFLSASGRVYYFMRDLSQVTPSTVGEALSRFTAAGILYRMPATFNFTYHPLGYYGKVERVQTSEIMGEPVYGISEATRIKILERMRFEHHLSWWNIKLLTPTAPSLPKLIKPVEYEWVVILKPVPRFRAAEDMKVYGPFSVQTKEGKPQSVKLPLVLAYFLVRTGYVQWLNAKREKVQQAEQVFRYQPTEKLKRQATLF